MPDLFDYPAEPFRICDDTTEQNRSNILQDIAVRGTDKPELYALAQTVWERLKSFGIINPLSVAQEALNAVHHLEYHPHPEGEWFQPTEYTIIHGGNCEDLSTVLVALLLRLGVPAHVSWINQVDKPLNHVAVKINIGNNDWRWADPSIAGARVGEEPYEALARLAPHMHVSELQFRAARSYVLPKAMQRRPAGEISTNLITIVSPADNATVNREPVTGAFEPITGTASAGTTAVIVTIDASPPQPISVDPTGRWSFVIPPDLPVGRHTVKVASGTIITQSSFTVTAAPVTPPVQPPVATLAITLPQAQAVSPVQTISGTALAGAQVSVSIDGGTAIPVTTDAHSTWSLTLPSPLQPGTHSIMAQTTDGGMQRVTAMVSVVAAPVAPPVTPPVAPPVPLPVVAPPPAVPAVVPPSQGIPGWVWAAGAVAVIAYIMYMQKSEKK